jgi:ATP-binding cassette, subfamily B, bacterial
MSKYRELLPWSKILRALAFVGPHRWRVAVILLLTLLTAAMSALMPMAMKFIFDQLQAKSGVSMLLVGISGLLALGMLREAVTGVTNWLSWRIRLRIHLQLLEETISRLHRLPLGLERGEGVGAIMTRLDRSIQGFLGAVSEISFNVLPAVFYLLIAVALMLRMDWRMSLLVLAFAPMPGLIAALAAPVQTNRERDLLTRWSRIYSRFNEVLAGIVTVRSFAMEDAEKEKFLTDVHDANRVVIRGIGFDTRIGAAQNLVMLFARIAAITLGGLLVLRGEATVGTLIAFLGYVDGLFGPVQGLAGIYRTMRTATVSLDQIFAILDRKDRLQDAPDAKEVNSLRGEVTFEQVGFAYEVQGMPVLKDIDLQVRPGEMLALVGPSGSGKTTLMALLQRFQDPRQGRILVDGCDLRQLKQQSLRRQIGVVLQDAVLFNESIRNNIAYGRPDATLQEIEEAARAANAHEFILRLEEGYDTMAGERGNRLSGGERQRIAIARALLKQPAILILDEATSALDVETEFLIQQALERLIQGRTTIVIAHRLSTVIHADRIIVLKRGQIIESGNHHELLAARGYYAMLVDRQTKGMLGVRDR